jgi:hypothetical protein
MRQKMPSHDLLFWFFCDILAVVLDFFVVESGGKHDLPDQWRHGYVLGVEYSRQDAKTYS